MSIRPIRAPRLVHNLALSLVLSFSVAAPAAAQGGSIRSSRSAIAVRGLASGPAAERERLRNLPMAPLGESLTAWTLRGGLEDLGCGPALESGHVRIHDDYRVEVRNGTGHTHYEGVVRTRGDVVDLLRALRAVVPQRVRQGRVGRRSFEVNRSARYETRVNDRMWHNRRLTTQMDPRYMEARRYDLPLVQLPAERIEIVRVSADIPGMERLLGFFVQPDGSFLLPIHPQELSHRGFAAPTRTLPVRNASSERTVHATLPGMADALIKLDLAHVLHSGVTRPIPGDWAREAVNKSAFLIEWSRRHLTQGHPTAFMPEVLALVDRQVNASVIIRSPRPVPAARDGVRAWSVPVYSLSARDPDHSRPLAARIIDGRLNRSIDLVDYADQVILTPLIENSLTFHVDLGGQAQDHGQNTHFEFGEDGNPTGRILNADLEDLLPYAPLVSGLDHADFERQYGTTALTPGQHSQAWSTFNSYFLSQTLAPLLRALRTAYPERAQDITRRATEIIHRGLERRRAVLEQTASTVGGGFLRALGSPEQIERVLR